MCLTPTGRLTPSQSTILPIGPWVPTQDKVSPPTLAMKAAQKIGAKAVLKHYSCGHMNICLGENFEKSSNDQLAFFSPGIHVLMKGNEFVALELDKELLLIKEDMAIYC